MNTADIAKMLDGRQYKKEMTPEIELALDGTDIVVVFGASDDLMEFRGAVYDELNGTGTAYFTSKGLLANECDEDCCPYWDKLKETVATIEGIWHDESDDEFCFTYKTNIPHECFIIWDGEDKYCRGIVFRLADVDNGSEA